MTFVFDFGFEAPSASWDDAFVTLFFASNASADDLSITPGPTAIADTSRYIELFENPANNPEQNSTANGNKRENDQT